MVKSRLIAVDKKQCIADKPVRKKQLVRVVHSKRLKQIIDLINEENILQDMHLQDIDFSKMLNLKQKGFADQRIADLLLKPGWMTLLVAEKFIKVFLM